MLGHWRFLVVFVLALAVLPAAVLAVDPISNSSGSHAAENATAAAIGAGAIGAAALYKGGFLDDMWNGFTGAMSGLGKTVYFGAKEQYGQYSDIASTALKGDISGAGRKLLEKNLRDAAFVGQTVMDHWEEIAIGVAVAVVIVAAVVTAPVWVPVVAAAAGVSAAAVTAVGVGVGAAAAVGTAYYVATTYGAKLNTVDKNCPLENGAAKECVAARTDVVEQGIVDGTILLASIGIGSAGSTWANAVAKAKIVDHPNVLKAMETILKPRGVKFEPNAEYLRQRGAFGIYDINNKKLTYGDQTRFGDLMHEVRHSTDHAKVGYPTTWKMTEAELNIYNTKTEINAYSQDLDNAKNYGYSDYETKWLTEKVKSLKIDLVKLEGVQK